MGRAIFLTNVVAAVVAACFVLLGLVILATPPRDQSYNIVQRHFQNMFWHTQGIYLAGISGIACGATIYGGVLRRDFADCNKCLRVDMWVGALKFDFGRALFFFFGGYYVYMLVAEFQEETDLSVFWVYLGKLLGLVSMGCGLFEGIFDVIVYNCMREIDGHTAAEERNVSTAGHAKNARSMDQRAPDVERQGGQGSSDSARSIFSWACCSSGGSRRYEQLSAP